MLAVEASACCFFAVGGGGWFCCWGAKWVCFDLLACQGRFNVDCPNNKRAQTAKQIGRIP